jgi:type IX secretion system PorP/SprF family membrane protein
MNKILVIFYALFFMCLELSAQHFQFSQFYAAPTYLNPAFTGANVCSRFSINYRRQWSGIPGDFTTYQASYDHYLKSAKSGIGFQVFGDNAGLGGLATLQVSFLYAYETRLSKKLMGRGGISLGSIQRRVNFDAFTFADQIARGSGQTVESLSGGKASYFDTGVGILVYSATSWAGFSASHLNKPNQSLMNGISPLPPELKLHGGYKFIIEEVENAGKRIPEHHSVTFAFNYKKQNKFNQADIGVYYTKNLFVVGCWYRGIPVYKPVNGYQNNDAVIFLFGLNMDKYRVGYSYDMTISRLTNINTKGSHEISMSYQFCKFKKVKRRKNILISCPKF